MGWVGGAWTVTGQSPGSTTIKSQGDYRRQPLCQFDFLQSSPRQVASSCTVGVTNVAFNKVSSTKGAVRFRVTNTNCPSGAVTVAIAPLDITGTLSITSYNPAGGVDDVGVPGGGGLSPEQTYTVNVSGAGTVKFQVSITQCNGQSCSDLKWDRSPNNVQTGVQTFP